MSSPDSPKSSPLLLSKSEATLFLRVHILARQLDHLLQLSYEALYRSCVCRNVSTILSQNSHRAWLPTIYLHGWTLPQRILHHYVPIEMRRILQVELHPLVRSLRDLADQNWNYVQLLQQQNPFPLGPTSVSPSLVLPTLAWEKSVVAQIQEILCTRIEHLIENGFFITEDTVDESMEDICLRLTQQTWVDTDETPANCEESTIEKADTPSLDQQEKKATDESESTYTRLQPINEVEINLETSTDHATVLKESTDIKPEMDTANGKSSCVTNERTLSCSQVSKGEECWAQLYG